MKRDVIASIPDHLKPYIVEQDASLYTPMDHAGWRYILKVARHFFSKHAHQTYLDGLAATGISSEKIPLISEMDEKLKLFGWRAVAVSGFIPPAAFMEFQALGILPIACDMRSIEHMAYTPAPDIVHEAAGHAPIIADPQYSEYLRQYGEVSRKAVFSKRDMELYEAIRRLSEVKEDPRSTADEIQKAQTHLTQVSSSIDYVSEASYLSRMYWWTVEYGLVGDPSAPKIYGAGLLSSLGESYHCLSDHVAKIPFTLDCMNRSYDITRPQPQLFVSPDFQSLTTTLKDYAETMAFKKGGIESLSKALQAQALTTTVLDTGVQISGVLSHLSIDEKSQPYFLKYSGPVQISVDDRELPGQGISRHKEGYSSPIGSFTQSIDNEFTVYSYKSGIVVRGKKSAELLHRQKPILITLEECTVSIGSTILYQPEWGLFDLALGQDVVSVFGGAADFRAYYGTADLTRIKKGSQKSNLTPENRGLNEIYSSVRKLRETTQAQALSAAQIQKHWVQLQTQFPNDWLCRFELLELATQIDPASPESNGLRSELTQIQSRVPENSELIRRGLEILQ